MPSPTITKQVLENGFRNYVASFTCVVGSDLDAIADYLALDPTASGDMGVNIAGNVIFPGTHLKILRLGYDLTDGVGMRLTWDATTPQDAWVLNGTGAGKQNFKPQGGLYVPQAAGAPIPGATGKVFFNSVTAAALGAFTAGDFFSIMIYARKDISQ